MTTPDPPLRLATFEVCGFRAFGRVPQVLGLRGGDGSVRELTVLHGDNSSGKSSALLAIDLLFRAWMTWLRSQRSAGDRELRIPLEADIPPYDLWLSRRDWNANAPRDPLVLRATFEGFVVDEVRVEIQPVGDEASVSVTMTPELEGPPAARALIDRLELVERMGKLPFVLIDSHRRGPWLVPESRRRNATERVSLLADRLLGILVDLKESIDVSQRARWRDFCELVGRFDRFSGFELSVARDPHVGGDTLVIEKPGVMVLKFDELSSGEQQVLAICAAVVATGAPIVAIEEPELNLSPRWQQTLRGMLVELVKRGTVHQILLESHVPAFDGPRVLRFARGPDGVTVEASVPTEGGDPELRARAIEAGADERWVTADGYTQLPDLMVEALGLRGGGHLWFLQHGGHWGAWPEAELTLALGGDDSNEDPEESR